MGPAESDGLDHWRKFFRTANSDIFDVIENAILIAASDCPQEFRNRRDLIAEILFSCRSTRCVGCNRVELQVPNHEEGDHGSMRGRGEAGSDHGDGEKDSKVNSSTTTNDAANDADEYVPQMVSNYSYDEAEALTEEIEEESQTVGEVLRIKEILASKKDESDSVLYESLRRLQLMALSVETLQVSEIGKAVNGLRKHNSKHIRNLARILIEEWKILVDEWVGSAPALTEATPESMKPENFEFDEEGLPSPPLDEGAFLATQTTSIELSKFFEGMDDDGNPGHNGELSKNVEREKKTLNSGPRNSMRKQTQPTYLPSLQEDEDFMNDISKQNREQEDRNKQNRYKEVINRPTKPQESMHNQLRTPAANSVPARSPKPANGHKFNGETNYRQLPTSLNLQRKPSNASADKLKSSEDNSVRAKLEMAKRKLQERYQEAENAKKQRTIQVMELHDLPKNGLTRKPIHLKQGNHSRHWNNARR